MSLKERELRSMNFVDVFTVFAESVLQSLHVTRCQKKTGTHQIRP